MKKEKVDISNIGTENEVKHQHAKILKRYARASERMKISVYDSISTMIFYCMKYNLYHKFMSNYGMNAVIWLAIFFTVASFNMKVDYKISLFGTEYDLAGLPVIFTGLVSSGYMLMKILQLFHLASAFEEWIKSIMKSKTAERNAQTMTIMKDISDIKKQLIESNKKPTRRTKKVDNIS